MPDLYDLDEKALRARVKALEEENAGLRQQNFTVIGEKRKLEGKLQGTTTEGVMITDNAYILPKGMADDHQVYKHWRRKAQDDGKELQFAPDRPVEPQKLPDRYVNEQAGIVYINANLVADHAVYQREKALAEDKRMRLVPCRSPQDWPQEAFLPPKESQS